jgi:hypothetical protein
VPNCTETITECEVRVWDLGTCDQTLRQAVGADRRAVPRWGGRGDMGGRGAFGGGVGTGLTSVEHQTIVDVLFIEVLLVWLLVLVQPQPVIVTVTASGIRARRDGLRTRHESLVLG